MSRGPKFTDPTKPRGIYGTPTFKYLVATTVTVSGIVYLATHYIHLLLLEKQLEKLRSTVVLPTFTSDPIVQRLQETLRIYKILQRQEEEAKKKSH